MSEGRRRSRRVRALIVDDSPGFRRELRMLLELEEVVVIGEAANGWEAVELTEELEPDVILMDQNMPALSGVGATREIKNKNPNRRIIFVAAESEWREEALRAGADAYFVKGGDLEALVRAIHDPLAELRSRAMPAPPKPTREMGRTLAIAGAGIAVFGLLAGLIFFPSLALPGIALLFGFVFFLYGLKYYATNALILLATSGNGNGNGNGHTNGNGKLLGRLRNGNGHGNGNGNGNGKRNGLQGLGLSNGGNGRLHVQPFVSIHLPLYNEKSVVDRLLTACTNLDYDNYEVIVADDSTDETTQLLQERWEPHPRVRISHRVDRSGFKGGALRVALQVTDPRAEFIVVLDADFLPPPDIIHQFLAYFYGINGNGNGHHGNGDDDELRLIDDRVAVVQGYQWHILNASENWITKGIRSEFSGSYVVERAGQELLGSMKMISGSVFMIRADVLRANGWGTSITEDWELTLRLYLEGYKVLYTPFIQAPSECVASFKQLARQRMRWAEGHTFNVKQFFWEVLSSEKITRTEKLEFIYYAPYYLQSVLFVLGTGAWMLSELIFKFELPFWTETLGWALVFANAGSLVLMNLTGLFLERGIQRSWTGLFSFVLLTYLLIPYQAWAAIKGLLEPHEGGWHRTQKTGVITEAVDRMKLKKRMRKLMPKKKRKSEGRSKPSPAAALWRKLPAPLRAALEAFPIVGRTAPAWLGGALVLALLGPQIDPELAAPGTHLMLAGAIFIPTIATLLHRHPRLATRLLGVGVSAVLVLAIFSQNVAVATAAPDTFYLHQTASGSMALSTDFGTFTANLGTGNQAVTGVGFQPKAVLFWITDRTGAGTGQFARFGRGWTDGANQGAVATAWDDEPVAANTNDSRSRIVNDKSVTLINHTGTVLAEAEIVSLDSDGFTINWTTGGGLRLVTYLAIGGEALTNVSAGGILWSTGTTFSETGVGFQPDALLLAGVENTAVFGTSTQGGHGFGIALSPTDRHSDAHRWRDQKTDANSGSSGLDTRYALALADDTSTPDQAYDLQSMDTDGFTLDLAVGVSGDQVAIIYLALQGLSTDRGVITQPTATGTQSVTGLSFQPTAVLFDGGDKATTDGFEQDAEMVAGVATGGGAQQAGFWIGAGNSTSPWPSDTALSTTRVITSYAAGTPSLEADARMNSLNADGFTIEWMTADATQRKIGWIAFGGATISPAGEFMNRIEGSSATTKTFDTAGQNAYWYVDEIWPTGDADGGIAAGAYTFNMYFNQLPSASPQVDAVNPGTTSTDTITISHTTSGSDRLMLVGVSINNSLNETVSTIKYNNVDLVFVGAVNHQGSGGDDSRVEIWKYENPPAITADVVITFSADLNHHAVAGVITFTGVNQSDPLRTFASNYGDGTSASVSIPSDANELALGVFACETCTSMSVDSPSTQQWSEQVSNNTFGAGGTRAGANPNVTISASLGSSDHWAAAGISIKPAAATVDITASVHHTKPDGSDPQLITSASTTISGSTSDPLAFSLGSGAAQTFTSADPRRLRLHVTVDSISNGGSFVLDYDDSCASGKCSNLDTPVVTVPDFGLAFLLFAPLVPYLMSYLWKRRRRAAQLMSVLLAVSVTLGMLARDVDPVTAAPDTFYFHDTNTTGITPAGKYMDNTAGSAGSTMAFNSAGQNAYWYHDVTWPTGSDDASIAAGTYTGNLYFNSLPSTQAPAVDAVSSGDTRRSSVTISHTTGSGSNRLMLVGISFVNDELETVSSITYGASSLVKVGERNNSDDARVEIWRLIAPASGTANVVVNFSAPLRRSAVVGVMTFNGVHQTTPLGTFASAAASTGNPSVAVSSATNELVFDTVACETCTSLSVGAGQTQRWNLAPQDGTRPSPGAGSTEPGATSVTMSWTMGTLDHWAIGGVSIKPSGGSAPTVDATSSAKTDRNTITIQHTTSGAQRLMLVGITFRNHNSETVSTVTYNGAPLASVGSVASTNDARVEIWRLIAPDTGTHNVVITFNTELQYSGKAGVMTFTGVDQTTPLGTFASASGDSTGPATVNVTSATNELVFDTVGCRANDSGTLCSSLTVGAGQTERWNLGSFETGDSTRQTKAAGSTEPGAGTVTMSWTIAPASAVPWAIGAVPIKPAAASVDIQLTVSHTASDGSGATTIVTSPVTTINSGTADPLALNIGSGALQTFTSADPRRLRLRINVVSTSGGGSFVLDYDGTCATSRCSNLDTPVVTVPEFGLILLPLAVAIPALVRAAAARRSGVARSPDDGPQSPRRGRLAGWMRSWRGPGKVLHGPRRGRLAGWIRNWCGPEGGDP